MTFEQQRRLATGSFTIEMTREEILADLCWPGPPPGQWLGAPVRHESIELPLAQIEREAA